MAQEKEDLRIINEAGIFGELGFATDPTEIKVKEEDLLKQGK